MTEAQLVTKIIKKLKEFGGCWYKIHGGRYQVSGISDIIGCYKGQFIALEVKLPGKEKTLTKLQEDFIETIIKNGGKGRMITNFDQALELLQGD